MISSPDRPTNVAVIWTRRFGVHRNVEGKRVLLRNGTTGAKIASVHQENALADCSVGIKKEREPDLFDEFGRCTHKAPG
jgi:hypothetical protein